MADAEPEALVTPTRPGVADTTTASSASKTSSFPPAPVYPTFKTPALLPKPPFCDVDGIPNFRLLGGYLCSPTNTADSADTKTHIIRTGFLYRCAHPTQITPEGVDVFSNGLRIKAIYDLRSESEVVRTNVAAASTLSISVQESIASDTSADSPSFGIRGATRYFTPVFSGEDYSPEGLARRMKWYTTGASLDLPRAQEIGPYSPGFVNAYRDILRHGASAYTKIFRHILETPDDPLVFHCTAGKDRTGVFAALVLRLAGVDDDTICWEYALTEPGLGAWRDLFIKRMTDHGLHSGQPEKSAEPQGGKSQVEKITRQEAANICGSKAGNMRAFLKLVLDEENSGVEAYLKNSCGFSKQEIEKMRNNLVIPLSETGSSDVIVPMSIQGWTPEGGVED